jgi:endonuclease-3
MASCICQQNRTNRNISVSDAIKIATDHIDYLDLQTYPRSDHPDPARRGTLWQVLAQIVISQRATLRAERQAADRLFSRLPDAASIRQTDVTTIASLIQPAGFQTQKARQLKRIASEIEARLGDDLERLKVLPFIEARAILMSLPGVGPKTADCFLELGLDFPVLPIETNIAKLARGLGWVEESASLDLIQEVLQKELPVEIEAVRDAHTYLLALGQRFCWKSARCSQCPLCITYGSVPDGLYGIV